MTGCYYCFSSSTVFFSVFLHFSLSLPLCTFQPNFHISEQSTAETLISLYASSFFLKKVLFFLCMKFEFLTSFAIRPKKKDLFTPLLMDEL